jgi:uncharacterized protein YbjT (DUF2867 family)
MYLVVGATGILGTEICRRLRSRSLPVRALVRSTSDAAKVGALRAMGCETAIGDLQDQGSLEAACDGVDSVVSTASTTISRQPHDSLGATDLGGNINLIDAARKTKVQRFVLISVSGTLEGDTALHRAKRTVEQKLRDSGLSFTILRPTFFMEVWLSPILGFDFMNRKVQIFGSGEKPISFISLYDVAEFAVLAGTSAAAANRTIELGGPEAVSPRHAVKIFEKELGGPIEITNVPQEAIRQQYESATEEYEKTFAGLTLRITEEDQIDMKQTLKEFPVKMTSVRDYARKIAESLS